MTDSSMSTFRYPLYESGKITVWGCHSRILTNDVSRYTRTRVRTMEMKVGNVYFLIAKSSDDANIFVVGTPL